LRAFGSLVLAALLLGACRIERTPQEYIDHRTPVVQVRQAAADELNARLLAVGQALFQGDSGAVMAALALAPDAYVITTGDTLPAAGAEEIRAALEAYLARTQQMRLGDVRVTIGPRGTTAWFRADLLATVDAGREHLRVTGVLVQGDDGGWELAQAHLSYPTAAPRSYPAGGGTPRAGE
jgi:ketosteroid isomerase-like protein